MNTREQVDKLCAAGIALFLKEVKKNYYERVTDMDLVDVNAEKAVEGIKSLIKMSPKEVTDELALELICHYKIKPILHIMAKKVIIGIKPDALFKELEKVISEELGENIKL